jgi:hypothetical protein
VLDGLIRSTDNPPDADARRTPYEITPLGVTVFDEWLTAHDAGAGGPAEDEISARLLFADDSDPATMLRVLDRLQENVWFYGKSLERARRQALVEAQTPGAPDAFRVLPLLLGRRLKHVAADIEFLGELRASYQQHLPAPPAVAEPEPVRAIRTLPRRRRA